MYDTATLILAILGAVMTWTGSVLTLGIWVSSRFRSLERMIYQEQKNLDEKYMAMFKDHGDRLLTLELRKGGAR